MIEAGIEGRDASEPMFLDWEGNALNGAALRMAITRACEAARVPAFTPHDLRHRRVSLLHSQGRTFAEIGQLVGHRSSPSPPTSTPTF